MKAFILSAGQGTRLIPLTINRPKPMLPVLNKPVLEHILEWLSCFGIEEFVINLHHKPECIKKYFKTLRKYKITYSEEPVLLGTAGAVKKCQPLLNETFLVVYGDNIFRTDLTDFFKFHRERKSKLTMGLIEEENIAQSGIALVDEQGKILRFKEKPKEDEIFSHLTNAGIYLVEPEILEYVPKGRFYDFGKDLFPQLTLTKRRGNLFGFKLRGFLEDMGTLEKFLKINLSLLDNGQSVIGKSCNLKEASIQNSCIGDNCLIEEGAFVKDCILDRKVRVGKNSRLENSIILEETSVGEGVKINGAVITEKCFIGDGASITKGAKLWPGVKVGRKARVLANIFN
jgi:mannose-1-phosphate guanylyltransferase/phosphomannomutase